MKRCPECRESKHANEYYVYDKGKRLSSYCKKCQRKRSLKRYHGRHSNPNYKNKRTRNKTRDRARIRSLFSEYLRSSRCLDCGISDPVVLVFHHRDPKEKLHGISHMIHNRYGWKSILDELAKCDCLCANCHSTRHYKQGEYRKYLNAFSSEE